MRIEMESYEQDGDRVSSYYKEESPLWVAPNVVTKRKNNKSDCIDFMWGILVLSARAMDILTPLIGSEVEFLPLIHSEHELYAVKVNRVQDFIDMTNPVERKIGYGFFKEYVHIHPEKIEPEAHVFKLPQHPSRIYVSDDFKNTVDANKLKTFQFIKVWDTEDTDESRKERLKYYDEYYDGLATRETVSFQAAMDLLKRGKQVRNNNKVLKSEDGKLLIGEILDNGTEQWIYPTYIPPLFLEQMWYVYETAESDRIFNEYFAERSYEMNGPKGVKVIFKDENLERMVRKQVEVYKEELTETNLLKLRHLIPRYDDGIVTSLSGIRYAKNLVEFMIKDNTGFNPIELRHLPDSVQSLAVNNCGLMDLEMMKELILLKLSSVSFIDNRIVNLEPLVPHPSLTWMNVTNNRIEDVHCLNALPELRTLVLSHNPVMNIHELQLPNLHRLDLEGIETADWSFLVERFPNLRYVSISDEKMTNASRKSMRDVIRSKKFAVSWTESDGMSKLYNQSFLK